MDASSIFLPPAPNWYTSQSTDFSSDGRLFAYAANDKIVVIDMFARPPVVHAVLTDGHPSGKVLSLSFSRAKQAAGNMSSGYLLVSGGSDKQMVLWNAMSAKKVRTALRHGAGVTAIACLTSDAVESATCIGTDANGKLVSWTFGCMASPVTLQRSNRDERMLVTCMSEVAALPGHVVVGCQGGRALLIDTSSNKDAQVVCSWDPHPSHDIQGLSVHSKAAFYRAAAFPEILVATGAGTDPTAKCRVFRIAGTGPQDAPAAAEYCHISITLPPASAAIPESQRNALFVTPQFLPPGSLDHLLASAPDCAALGPALCLTGAAGAVHCYVLSGKARQPPAVSLRLPGQHSRSVFSLNFPPTYAPEPAPLPMVTTSLDRSLILWSLPRELPAESESAAPSSKDAASSTLPSSRTSSNGEAAPSSNDFPPLSAAASKEAEAAWLSEKLLRAAGGTSQPSTSAASRPPAEVPGVYRRLFSKATVKWSFTGLGGYPHALQAVRAAPYNQLLVASGDSTLRLLPHSLPQMPAGAALPRPQTVWTGSNAKAQATAVAAFPGDKDLVAFGLADGTLSVMHMPTQSLLTFSHTVEGEVAAVAWLDLGDAGSRSRLLEGWALVSLGSRGSLQLWQPAESESLVPSKSANKKILLRSQLPPLDLLHTLREGQRVNQGASGPTALAVSPDNRILAVGFASGLVISLRLIPMQPSAPYILQTDDRASTGSASTTAPEDPLAVMVLEGSTGAPSSSQAPRVSVDMRAFASLCHSAVLAAPWAAYLPRTGTAAVTSLCLGASSDGSHFLLGTWAKRGLDLLLLLLLAPSEDSSVSPSPSLSFELLHRDLFADVARPLGFTALTWRPENLQGDPTRRPGSKSALFVTMGSDGRGIRMLEAFGGLDGTAQVFAFTTAPSAPFPGLPAPALSVDCSASKSKITVFVGLEDATVRSLDLPLKDLLKKSSPLPRPSAQDLAPVTPEPAPLEWARTKAAAPATIVATTSASSAAAAPSPATPTPPQSAAASSTSLLGAVSLVPTRGISSKATGPEAEATRMQLLHAIVRLARLARDRAQHALGGLSALQLARTAAQEAEALRQLPGTLPLSLALPLAHGPLEASACLLEEVDRQLAVLPKQTGMAKLRLASRLAVLSIWAGDLNGALDILLQSRVLSPQFASALLPLLQPRMEPADFAQIEPSTTERLLAQHEPQIAAVRALVVEGQPREAIRILAEAGLAQDAHALARARLLPSDPALLDLTRRVRAQMGTQGPSTEDQVAYAAACGDWVQTVRLLGGFTDEPTFSGSSACALEVAQTLTEVVPGLEGCLLILRKASAANGGSGSWPPSFPRARDQASTAPQKPNGPSTLPEENASTEIQRNATASQRAKRRTAYSLEQLWRIREEAEASGALAEPLDEGVVGVLERFGARRRTAGS